MKRNYKKKLLNPKPNQKKSEVRSSSSFHLTRLSVRIAGSGRQSVPSNWRFSPIDCRHAPVIGRDSVNAFTVLSHPCREEPWGLPRTLLGPASLSVGVAAARARTMGSLDLEKRRELVRGSQFDKSWGCITRLPFYKWWENGGLDSHPSLGL